MPGAGGAARWTGRRADGLGDDLRRSARRERARSARLSGQRQSVEGARSTAAGGGHRLDSGLGTRADASTELAGAGSLHGGRSVGLRSLDRHAAPPQRSTRGRSEARFGEGDASLRRHATVARCSGWRRCRSGHRVESAMAAVCGRAESACVIPGGCGSRIRLDLWRCLGRAISAVRVARMKYARRGAARPVAPISGSAGGCALPALPPARPSADRRCNRAGASPRGARQKQLDPAAEATGRSRLSRALACAAPGGQARALAMSARCWRPCRGDPVPDRKRAPPRPRSPVRLDCLSPDAPDR